jgi:microcystin degradation protein MlrC
MLLEDLRQYRSLDGVYLDLHGAMVTEHAEDGEGELLARVRKLIGDDIPVVNSLDLHANITERMVANSSAMTIFRTYPHIDMAATGERAYHLLSHLMAGGRLSKAFRKLPFLVPLSAQWTGATPNRELYAQVHGYNGNVVSIDLALGFPPADIRECGAAVVAYDVDPEIAQSTAADVFDAFMQAEPLFENNLLSADDAVCAAMDENAGPVVLADAQDNPGAGGTSDTVGILDALVRHRAQGAVVAFINDPEVADMAHALSVGDVLETDLGEKSGRSKLSPFHGRFRIETLGDGVFECTGEMDGGVKTDLGRTAVLRVELEGCDVRVIVSSRRFQNLDRACFTHLGIEPENQHILVVKSTVHFRADYDPIAARTIIVESPGEHPCRLTALDYRNLRSGVRLEPMGPTHAP